MPATKPENHSLRERLLKSHDALKLAGDPPNQLLLDMPEPMIGYFRAILKQQPLTLPDAEEKDWINAIRILASHEILPLLHRRIHDLPEKNRPPCTIIEKLRSSFMSASVRSMQVEKQLGTLLSAIGKSGEKHLVLKGPAISGSLYPDTTMRSYNDIDILVMPDRFPKVRQVLLDLGYVCSAPRFDRYRDLHSEESFVHLKDRMALPVELHWDIHHFFGFRGRGTVNDLFGHAIPKTFGALSFCGLDPVDELIHLVLHLVLIHTRDIRLIWLYDIFLLATQIGESGRWQELTEICQEWSATLAVFHILQLVRIWTPLSLPDEVNSLDKWPKQHPAEEKAWQSVLKKHRHIHAMISLRLPPGLPWIKKAIYIVDFVFPPKENLKKRYAISHDFLLPYYYLKRLFERLARRSWKR
ncbi:MAG: nucleotidyltransferase family protein [Proteobacteria bacterium]|nr:nucleotidyltransferase family protein [Pseudomonadota bacterium]